MVRRMLAAVEPPQIANVEEEAALLGAMMHEPKIIDAIADKVSAEDFSEPLHGRVFDAILSLHNAGRTVSVITLKPLFDDDPAMTAVGGPAYLVTIMGTNPVAVIGAKDFAGEIHELAQRRRLIDGLRSVIQEGHKATATVGELVSGAEDALAAITETQDGAREFSAAQCLTALVDNLGRQEPGVYSGITALDAALGDIRKEDVVILGARPGMGKSATASSYALGAALRGHPTLFVSLEMSTEALAERMASDLCFDGNVQVPYGAITSRHLTTEQAREIARAADRIHSLPLTVVRYGGMTTGRLNSIVRRHKRRLEAKGKKLELVIVDYLQLMRPDAREKDLYTRITEVSKGLKDMAVAQGVGVMALCQLSREVEKRQDKRPQMSDLRDSGQIEQDADSICFLYAPEYYLLQSEDSPEREEALREAAGKIEFIVPKRRRGPSAVGHGHFYRAFQAVR